jgi:hypothetical protein
MFFYYKFSGFFEIDLLFGCKKLKILKDKIFLQTLFLEIFFETISVCKKNNNFLKETIGISALIFCEIIRIMSLTSLAIKTKHHKTIRLLYSVGVQRPSGQSSTQSQ